MKSKEKEKLLLENMQRSTTARQLWSGMYQMYLYYLRKRWWWL